MKDFYSNVLHPLMKWIVVDKNTRKGISCSWTGKTNIVRMSIPPKSSRGLMQSSSSFQRYFFFYRSSKKPVKFIRNHKRPWIAKKSWERRSKQEASHILISSYTIKLYSSKQEVTGIKKRQIDQWKKIENPEITPSICS